MLAKDKHMLGPFVSYVKNEYDSCCHIRNTLFSSYFINGPDKTECYIT
jgi:hypothetical protein